MSKEGDLGGSNPYRLSQYSISNLLNLLTTARAEKAMVEVGYTPALVRMGQRIEIDGPDVLSEVMEELVRSVANTRELRRLRECGIVDIIQNIRSSRFLVTIVDAFGVFRLDLILIKSE